MTSGERKALLFLAGIGVLGAGARLLRTPSRAPGPAERQALQQQLGAVDSARQVAKAPKAPKAPKTPRPKKATHEPRPTRTSVEPSPLTPAAGPVDVDVADARALESLPGIGPALAARIVADRAARGAFGSLEGLERVRGVGHKLATRLASRVTFSGVSRPSPAGVPMR
jgi:competence protein ComEA